MNGKTSGRRHSSFLKPCARSCIRFESGISARVALIIDTISPDCRLIRSTTLSGQGFIANCHPAHHIGDALPLTDGLGQGPSFRSGHVLGRQLEFNCSYELEWQSPLREQGRPGLDMIDSEGLSFFCNPASHNTPSSLHLAHTHRSLPYADQLSS